MQISATLVAAQQLAAQQAAREAQARATHFIPATDFAAALEKEGVAPAKPLQAPVSQTNAAQASRPGSLLDIKI